MKRKRLTNFILSGVMLFSIPLGLSDNNLFTSVSISTSAATSADFSISQNGIEFICAREGFSQYCYYDGAQSSIGYGTKCGTAPHASGLHSITKEAAMTAMKNEINSSYVPNVKRQTAGITMNQNQFDALVSFTYNTGGGTTMIKNSPLVKYLRGELTEAQARSQFSNYIVTNSATGKVDQGLINRRNREADLFFTPTEPEKYTVAMCYNANGGEIADDSDYYLDGDTIRRKSDNSDEHNHWQIDTESDYGLYNASTFKLTRDGCDFLGWSLSENSGTIYDQDDGSVRAKDFFPDIENRSGKVTFYAQWGGHVMNENESAGRTIPDGNYWIVNALSRDYLLDISGNNYDTNNGKNLQMCLWKDDNWGKYDVFTVKYLNNGFYSITQYSTNMALDVWRGSLEHGTNVQMYESAEGINQQWSIKATADGYTIQSRCNSLYLDVAGGEVETDCNVQMWEGNGTKSQSFGFVPYQPKQLVKDGSIYRIGTINGEGYYINGAGNPSDYKNGQNVQLWNENGDNYFRFKLCDDGYYKIIDTQTGYALDVYTGGDNYVARDRNVQFYEETDAIEQHWAIRPAEEEGYYYIISKLNGHYLDLDDGVAKNGTNIHTWSASGNTQKWSFIMESGDVNQDGTISVGDIITMQKYLHAKQKITKAQFEASDMNGDGKVNVIDLALMKRQLLQK